MNISDDNTENESGNGEPVDSQAQSDASSSAESSTASDATEAQQSVSTESVSTESVSTEQASAETTEADVSSESNTDAVESPGELVDLDDVDLDGDYEEEEFEGDADPLEEVSEEPEDDVDKSWYILKVQVNRENSICDALERRVKMHGLESQFGDILVPTEDIKEFTKTGKQRIVKRKLYPGYIVVNMAINDDTWFIVRETPGIGDFTGSAGKPAPLDNTEVDRILKLSRPAEAGDVEGKEPIKNSFPFKVGDQVRVNEGNFQSLEGGVETIDESNGRITVMLNMFGRQTPVQLDHWQVEKV